MEKLPLIKPEKGYLDKIHSRTQKSNAVIEKKKAKAPGETTTSMAAVSRSNRMSSISRYHLKTSELSFFEKINLHFFSKLRTPAFSYAVGVHLVILGLCIFLYQAEIKISNNKPSDVQGLRFQAFSTAIQQNIFMGKIKLDSLAHSGEVYIVQTSRCLQIQKNKPLKGLYMVATIENDELQLDQAVIDRYFKNGEVKILVFNGAVEVWSKNNLEKYIQEEVPFRHV